MADSNKRTGLWKAFGVLLFAGAFRLVWDDESAKFPWWIRSIVALLLLAWGLWIYRHTMAKDFKIMWGLETPESPPSELPPRLAGVDYSELGKQELPKSPSKLKAFLTLVIIAAPVVATIFWAGYSCRRETAEVGTDKTEWDKLKSRNEHLTSEWETAVKDRNTFLQERLGLKKIIEELESNLSSREQTIAQMEELKGSLESELDDRKRRQELRDSLSLLSVRIYDLRSTLKQDEDFDPPIEQFDKLREEVTAFARKNLRPAQIALMDSNAGIDFPLALKGYKNPQAQSMWMVMFRWEDRLQQFMEATN